MIQITKQISISEKEIHEEFIRSSGPGGQNVNKVATAVQLRFNAAGSPSLPVEVRERLVRLAGRRLTSDGELIITAKRFRTQEKNRQDALERLIAMIRKACEKPVSRKKTKPTEASHRKRLDIKRRKSNVKKQRQNKASLDE
ncbi:MAG: alternative ribosome rescue aminoacyl-tRNA hydrolase ArfB [Spirochaetota bacterium]